MKPILSIITVTYNCEAVIKATLESVLSNKPASLEYIVVDGASTDSTVDKINYWKESIDIIVSEPDNGIYDAMNKGLAAANGEFVFFLNAGDQLYNKSTLSQLLSLLTSVGDDIFYGDTMLVDVEGRDIDLRSTNSSRKLPLQLDWKSLQRGMVVSHQAFVVRRSIAPAYNLEYRSSADIDWVIRCLKSANGVSNTGMVISKYLTGGFSKQRHPLSLQERYQILKHHYGFLPNLCNHLIIILRGFWFRVRGKALN